MKQQLHDWFGRRPLPPGVAAWAARLTDRTITSHCPGEWLTRTQLEEAVTRLSLAADNLAHQAFQPERLCWTFEHVRIHLTRRPDGVCLVLFAENRPGAGGDALDRLLNDFPNFDQPPS